MSSTGGGGSATVREAIEAKRAKIKTPGKSLKTLEKDAQRKKDWWNEKIEIAVMDSDGEPIPGSAWRVPRRRLTENVLQMMCLNCPEHVKIDYLKDQSTGDIVWPVDAQLHCNPPPWSYAVIAVEEKEVIDRSKDPFYYGDLQMMILNVPLTTQDDMTKVTAEEIKAWLIFGLLEEDADVTEAREIVHTLEAEAKVVEHNLLRVGYIKFTEKVGFGKEERQTLTDEEQAAKREEKHKALTAQRDKIEENLGEARDVLEQILKLRENTQMDLVRANVQPEFGTCTFYVSFTGIHGSTLEDVVCAKTDWLGIKLAAGHDGLPPWAGRGDIPDGSKSYIKRYTEQAINMRGVQICRLQHGFGQHKVARVQKKKAVGEIVSGVLDGPPDADPATASPSKTQVTQMAVSSAPTTPANAALASREGSNPASGQAISGTVANATSGQGGVVGDGQDDKKTQREGGRGEDGMAGHPPPFAGKCFYFYHGEYADGLKSGFGMEYTEADVYFGEYKNDKRNGVGALHCANGDHIEGNFVSETRFPEADSVSNPYRKGVCHGKVEIKCASGGVYKGEMKQGRITGKGEFVSCLGERYSGDFVDGRLHGRGSVMNVVGQVWEGRWVEGALHGEGRHSCAESGEYEGDWVRGEFEGKGGMTFKGGNRYEGFFLDQRRSGTGTLFRGNVKRVYDPRSGRKTLRSNRVYEANWRAGELRSGSMVTMVKAGMAHCAGPNKAVWYNRAIDRIKRREIHTHRKTAESLDFYGRYETLLRTEVEKKKSRLFARQTKLANQDLIDDHAKRTTAQHLKDVYVARAINLEQIIRFTGKQLESEAGYGSIARAAERLERIAASRGKSTNGTLLSKLLLSRLEEAQELQELVNITKIAAEAERRAYAEQAEMNYAA